MGELFSVAWIGLATIVVMVVGVLLSIIVQMQNTGVQAPEKKEYTREEIRQMPYSKRRHFSNK